MGDTIYRIIGSTITILSFLFIFLLPFLVFSEKFRKKVRQMVNYTEFRIRNIWGFKQIVSMRKFISKVFYYLMATAWFVFAEALFEYLFLGFTLYLLFIRLEAMLDYGALHPGLYWWQVVIVDISNNEWLYAVFIIIFFIWVIINFVRHIQTNDKQKEVTDKLNDINQTLNKIVTLLGGVNEHDKKSDE